MKTKKLFRRTITVFLSAVMLLASVPGSAAAAGASAVQERPETLSASEPSPEPSSDGLYSRRITVDLDKLADIITRDYSEEAIRRVDSENIVFVTDYEWAQKAGEALFSEAGKEDVLTVVSDNGTEAVRYTLVNGDAVAQDAYNSAVWLKEDGSELPVGEKPERPGIYRLKFSLPGSDTSTAAENTDIILRVDKTGLGVYSGKDESENDKLVRTVKAGTPYAGLTEANKDFWLSTLRFPKITKDSAPSRGALLNMAATEIKIGTREEDGSFRPITDEKDTVFRKDRIYVLIFDLVLKEDADDLYYVEPEDTVFYVAVGDKTETFMDFEYKDSALGTGLVRNYDGKEVTPSDILSVVSSSKLCYMDGDNKVVIKEDVAGTIDQDPDLTGFWVHSDGVTPLPLSANAVSAGTYFYKIVFHDDTAAYGSSEELIRLVINPVNAVVTPVYEPFEAPENGGEKEINEGTTAKEIIKDVTYRLTDSSGKDITDEIDRRYFWGTAYNYDEGASHEGYEVHTGQSYEPLFVLQEIKTEEGKEPVIRELSPSDAITADPSVSYRIVFSGDKAVFDADGNYSSRNSINSTSQDVDENSYRIDTGEDTRYAKANIVELKVRPGTPVSIDLSGIVAGKGKSLPEGSLFSKPVESEYDQAPLFAEKKDYRKATVSAGGEEIASDVSDFKYTWEMFDGEKLSTVLWSGPVKLERRIDAFMDRDGMVFDPPETDPDWPPDSASEEEWEDYHRKHAAFLVWNDKPGGDWQVDGKFTWNEIHGETSYDEELNGTWHGFDDPDAHWAAPSNPGIYRLKVTYHDPAHVNKDAAAYVYFVIHRIKAAAQIEGSPVSYADGLTTAGLVLDLLQGRDPSNADQYCGITLTAMNTASENRLPVPGSIRKRIAASPGAFLRVQKKTVSEGQTVWVSVDNPYDEVIKASDEYRLRFDPDSIKDETGLYLETYYNFYGDRTGTHDQLLNNVSTEAYGGTVPLTVRGSQAKPVEITVDDSRFSYGKVFDETGISLSDLEISTVSGTTALELPLRYIVRWVDKGIDYNDPALAVHAGEYRITIVCPATAEYAMAVKELGKSYRITKKKIKAVPTLKNPVFAGMDLDVSDLTVISQNLIESWKMEGFPGGADEFYLFDDYLEWIVLVFRSGIKQEMVADNRYRGLLTSGDEYFVTLDESEAAGANDPEFIRSRSDDFGSDISYGLDYEVRAEMKTFVPVRDHALISATEVDGSRDEYMQIQASYSHDPGMYEWTDLITAPAGVPFDYDSHRHFLVFDIHRPAEFEQGGRNKSFNKGGDFAFRENIEKAVKAYGGDPEKEDVITLKDDHITVRLDADLICKTESKKVSFDIIWDAGTNYSEHFVADLSDAQLFADLGEAVCPRSLSIVSDSRQMAVGDTGQLDARIKKNQNSDLILLAYESDNPDVLNVTGGLEDVLKEDQTGNNFHGAGFLTALKPGKATITAWPCRMVYDAKTGKTVKEKLKDGKPASVKITVTDVEAVKLGKVIPHDDKVVFTYRMPENGFRREAYILPGKISQAVFENRIREVKNGDYSAFTSVRLGLTEMSFDKASGRYVKALPKSEVSRDGDELPLALGDLKPDTQYTLYLRNVSGIRSVDGAAGLSPVAASAAGSVKTFMTGKPEPEDIGLSVNALDREDANKSSTRFLVKLSKKNVRIDAFGHFRDTSAEASGEDLVTKPVPLSGAEAKAYGKQKLTFVVMDEGAKELPPNTEPPSCDRKFYASYTDGKGNKNWYEKSRIAKISNKGKLTLLGQGLVKVICIDSVSGERGEIKVFIDADPYSVTVSKKAKKDLVLQPGESMWLSSVLEYREGKTSVAAYQGYTRTIDTAGSYRHMFADLALSDGSGLSDEFFSVERMAVKAVPYWDSSLHEVQYGEYHDYRIKALKSGGTKMLNVTDAAAGAVTVNLSMAPIEPVKQITTVWKDPVTGEKAGVVMDSAAFGFFTHSEKGVDAALENNSAGTLKVRLSLYDMIRKDPLFSEVREYKPAFFDAKKKVWVYCWSREGLTPGQQYRIGIRVLNGDGSEASEEKVLKLKTTEPVASHADLSLIFSDYEISDLEYFRLDEHTGGVDYNISVDAKNSDGDDASSKLSKLPVLTSGNTYTLTPVLGDGDCDTDLIVKDPGGSSTLYAWVGAISYSTVNSGSWGRCSDKLIWKVSDNKILKVKPKAGTYNAALTALKPGTAEITVASKLTKKVIMRRTVNVGAVAEGAGFFGVNEPYNRSYDWDYSYETPEDTTEESDILELTLDNPVRVELGSHSSRWFLFEAPAYGRYTFRTGTNTLADGIELERGQKFYIRLSGREYDGVHYLFAEGEIFESVSGDSFKVTAGSKTPALYTAAEDNYYVFSFVNDNGETRYLAGFTSAEGLESTGGGETGTRRFLADKISTTETGYGLRRGDVLQIVLDGSYAGITNGKTYLFTVRKCSVTDSLTVEKDQAFKIEDSEKPSQWFSFTAREEGVYTFSRNDDPGSAELSWSYAYSFMDEETRGKNEGTAIEGGTFECALGEGETVYLILSAGSPSEETPGKGSLNVSFTSVIPIEADGEILEFDVKPGEARYYCLTADEAGDNLQYLIKFENGTGLSIQDKKSLKSYFDGNSGSHIEPAPDWRYRETLDIGSKFYLKVWNDGDTEIKGVRIYAKHLRMAFLSEKETEGEFLRPAVDHGEAHYCFEVPKRKQAGIYRFTFTGPVGQIIHVRNGLGMMGNIVAKPKKLTADDNTIVFETESPLPEFSRYYFTVASDQFSGIITGKAEEVSFTQLLVGENKDLDSRFVSFAAEENDVYNIRFSAGDDDIEIKELGTTLFSFSNIPGTKLWEDFSYLSKRDGRIYFMVGETGNGDLSVTVTRREAVELNPGTAKFTIPAENFGSWFSFRPRTEGEYHFRFSCDVPGEKIHYYGYTGETLSEGTGYGTVLPVIEISSDMNTDEMRRLNEGLSHGKTLYFRVWYGVYPLKETEVTIEISKAG